MSIILKDLQFLCCFLWMLFHQVLLDAHQWRKMLSIPESCSYSIYHQGYHEQGHANKEKLVRYQTYHPFFSKKIQSKAKEPAWVKWSSLLPKPWLTYSGLGFALKEMRAVKVLRTFSPPPAIYLFLHYFTHFTYNPFNPCATFWTFLSFSVLFFWSFCLCYLLAAA